MQINTNENTRDIAEHLVRVLGQRLHETGEPPTATDVIERELNKYFEEKVLAWSSEVEAALWSGVDAAERG